MTKEKPKGKRGRPAHVPTDETRKQVEAMVGFGIPELDLAPLIGISDMTLRKYYKEEIRNGTTKANVKVAQSLYTKALGDNSNAVTAAIFWLKTRAGWKETSVHEHTGKDGSPLVPVLNVTVTPPKS